MSEKKLQAVNKNIFFGFSFELTIDYDLTCQQLVEASCLYQEPIYSVDISDCSVLTDRLTGKIRQEFGVIGVHSNVNLEDNGEPTFIINVLDILNDNSCRPATMKEILTVNLLSPPRTIRPEFLFLCSVCGDKAHSHHREGYFGGSFAFPRLSRSGDCTLPHLYIGFCEKLRLYDGILIVKRKVRNAIREPRGVDSVNLKEIPQKITKKGFHGR